MQRSGPTYVDSEQPFKNTPIGRSIRRERIKQALLTQVALCFSFVPKHSGTPPDLSSISRKSRKTNRHHRTVLAKEDVWGIREKCPLSDRRECPSL